ncbi:deoxynucleoside triphosphate triphosphohydrolase SAMHD1-like [Ruditapes philippinarum]|uniref:deoxynucleoside triphosphate triphosphohydrolase SAMHD1-like n=1 Tax=Ruditapes philippinarum TaxID=129788 RepID=UPI00295C1F1F|nr:deoxynucleoside triphosphate triphosphohydrolase SAMHD1-like [Ruditapes philippinarum]XP_060603832.1 deoxynucleoside triphosphate triphosphohydrolase SAMHD1-like [Ruditapes philippinarum]
MPQTYLRKYGHVTTAVYQCGFRITKELFDKRVKDLTPPGHDPSPWTVDDFLHKEMDIILKHDLGKDLKKTLFPGFKIPTDTEAWDLNTFCFLLIHFCKLRKNVKHDINLLRKLRNDLVHIAEKEMDLSDDTYKTSLDLIENIIKRCSQALGTPELEDELRPCLRDSDVMQSANFEEIKAKLRKWSEDEEKYNVWLEILYEDLEEFKAQLLRIQENYERSGRNARFPIPLSIAIRFIEIGRALENAVFAATNDESKTTTEIVARVRALFELIKDDVREMGPEVESNSSGSILFKFTCFSVSSLIYLINYFSGPILHRRVHDIAKSTNENEEGMVKIQICVPEENHQNIIRQLERDSTSSNDYQPPSKKLRVSTHVFNDPLYGQIELHPLCVDIIDTRQFQRLRYIKQLDTCYYVYPGASHNRFEHSIGVCHLAGKLLRVLKERQPELDITTKDILCVEIAALCHDLGQGPFSHVFEDKFLPAIDQDSKWRHERASVEMFEDMIQERNGKLYKLFREYIPGLEDRDIIFIKELIGVPPEPTSEKILQFKGRDKNKSFLYEVVANHVNGIDVDRWDYIARDSYMLGMKSVFDHNRCIQHARVIIAEGRKQICYRDKAAQDLYDMFYSRMALYRRAYQHKTHNIIGLMVRDALLVANEKLFFIGENGRQVKLSDTIKDMKAFTHLTDDILQQIQRSVDKDLETSREIINRIVQREFYKCVTQTQVDVKQKGWIVETEVQENLFNKINQKLPEPRDLSKIIEIDVVNLDYGSKEKDPIMNVWFFKKGQEQKAIRINKDQVSFILPDTFAEQYVRIYCSETDLNLFDIIEKSFQEWCTENNIPPPKGSDIP